MNQKEITDEKREALYREALSVHPDLMIAANNLASLLIKQNRADTTLLKPFITQDAPSAILVNQTVAYLQKRDFKKANHFAELLPDNKETEMVKALAAAMDGKYQEAYPTFEKQGGINQVILLLSMKQNQKAWEILKSIEDTSPESEYVRAIAANRLDNIGEAVTHLRNAIAQKPSLKEIALKDGDVLDLLDLLDIDKK
jgi:Flp pilus assembly protein TadD